MGFHFLKSKNHSLHQIWIVCLLLLFNAIKIEYVTSYQKNEAFTSNSDSQNLSHSEPDSLPRNSTPSSSKPHQPQSNAKEINGNENAEALSNGKTENEFISGSNPNAQRNYNGEEMYSSPSPSSSSPLCKDKGDGEVVWVNRLNCSCFFSKVLIEPAFLDWGYQNLCSRVPFMFSILNSMGASGLTLLGIQSNNPSFSSLDFKPVVLHPGTSHSIEMVLSSQTVGSAEAILKISTNKGIILVPMYAYVLPSPFRLEPILAFHVLGGMNPVYSLSIHNPHPHPITITEAYSNDSFLHLHLPSKSQSTQSQITQRREEKLVNGEREEDATVERGSQSASVWQLKPQETRVMLDIEFTSNVPGHYTGNVRLKIMHSVSSSPVDSMSVSVTIHAILGGLQQMFNELTFGILTKPKQEVRKPLELLNAGILPVLIEDVFLKTPNSNLIQIEFEKGLIIPPTAIKVVATLTYSALESTQSIPAGSESYTHSSPGESSTKLPKLIVRTNDSRNPSIEIPYRARVLYGGLEFPVTEDGTFLLPVFSPSAMQSESGTEKESKESKEMGFSTSQDIVLNNTFTFPVALYSAQVSDSHFQLLNFSAGSLLMPDVPMHVMSIRLSSSSRCHDSSIYANLTLFTNVTQFVFPLQAIPAHLNFSMEDAAGSLSSFTGRKHCDANLDEVVDLGFIGVGHMFVKRINVSNPLSKPMRLNVFQTGLQDVKLTLNEVWDHQGHPISNQEKSSMIKEAKVVKEPEFVSSFLHIGFNEQKHASFQLKPKHTASFSLKLTPKQAEKRKGSLFFLTSYEMFLFHVSYMAVAGGLALEPASIRFDPVFPGLVLEKPIYATSTFQLPLSLKRLISSHSCIILRLQTNVLNPGMRTLIGYASIDPFFLPPEDRYMGEKGQKTLIGWKKSAEALKKTDCRSLDAKDQTCRAGSVVEVWEVEDRFRRESLWKLMVAEGRSQFSTKITLEADIVGCMDISVHANLIFPTLLTETSGLDFSKVHVGKTAEKWIRVFNPSQSPVLVQLLLSSNRNHDFCSCNKHEEEAMCFSPPESLLERESWNWMAVFESQATRNASVFELKEGTRELILPPHTAGSLGPVFFSPLRACRFGSVFYLRNNLTKLESGRLEGTGGAGLIDFLETEEERTLRISISTEELGLKQGHGFSTHVLASGKDSSKTNAFMIKHNFTAVNSGDLTVRVTDVSICTPHGLGCRSRGFSVHGKKSFDLSPGQSRPISISYRPDFSSSLVKQELRVSTTSGIHSFSLFVRLPPEILPVFMDAMPESPLEKLFRQICLLGLAALVIYFTHSIMRDFTISPSPWFLIPPDPSLINVPSTAFSRYERHAEVSKTEHFPSMQHSSQHMQAEDKKEEGRLNQMQDENGHVAQKENAKGEIRQQTNTLSHSEMEKTKQDHSCTSAPVSPSRAKEVSAYKQLRAFSEGRNGSMDASSVLALEETEMKSILYNKLQEKENTSKKSFPKNNMHSNVNVNVSTNASMNGKQGNKKQESFISSPSILKKSEASKPASSILHVLPPSNENASTLSSTTDSFGKSILGEVPSPSPSPKSPPLKSPPLETQSQNSSDKTKKKKKKQQQQQHTPLHEPVIPLPVPSPAPVTVPIPVTAPLLPTPSIPILSKSPKSDAFVSRTPMPSSPTVSPKSSIPPLSFSNPHLRPIKTQVSNSTHSTEGGLNSVARKGMMSSISSPTKTTVSRSRNSNDASSGNANKVVNEKHQSKIGKQQQQQQQQQFNEMEKTATATGGGGSISESLKSNWLSNATDGKRQVTKKHANSSSAASMAEQRHAGHHHYHQHSQPHETKSEYKMNGSQNLISGSKPTKVYQRTAAVEDRTVEKNSVGKEVKEDVSLKGQEKKSTAKASKLASNPSSAPSTTFHASVPSFTPVISPVPIVTQKIPPTASIAISTLTEPHSLNSNLPESLFSPSDMNMEANMESNLPHTPSDRLHGLLENDRGGSTTSMLKLPSFVDARDTVLERPAGRRWPSKPLSPPGGVSSPSTLSPSLIHQGINLPSHTNKSEPTVTVGFPDELGLIGKKSLEQAEGGIGKMVYNIWGDYFPEMGVISSPRMGMNNDCNNSNGSGNNKQQQIDFFNRSLFTQTGFTPTADLSPLSAPTATTATAAGGGGGGGGGTVAVADTAMLSTIPHSPVALVQESMHSSQPSSPFSSPFPGFSIFSENASPRAPSRSPSPPLIAWNAPASDSPRYHSSQGYSAVHGYVPSRLHPQLGYNMPLGSVTSPTSMDASFWTNSEVENNVVYASEDSHGGSYNSVEESLVQDN